MRPAWLVAAWLLSTIATLVSGQTRRVLTGNSASRQTGTSEISCPPGLVPVDCKCHDWSLCGGAFAVDGKCTVVALRTTMIHAIRTNSDNQLVKPVVTCEPEYTRVYTKTSTQPPRVSCDEGSILTGCSFLQYSTDRPRVPHPWPVSFGNTCSIAIGDPKDKAFAICRETVDKCVSTEGQTFPFGPCSATCGSGEKSRVYYCTTRSGVSRFIRETVACSGPPCS